MSRMKRRGKGVRRAANWRAGAGRRVRDAPIFRLDASLPELSALLDALPVHEGGDTDEWDWSFRQARAGGGRATAEPRQGRAVSGAVGVWRTPSVTNGGDGPSRELLDDARPLRAFLLHLRASRRGHASACTPGHGSGSRRAPSGSTLRQGSTGAEARTMSRMTWSSSGAHACMLTCFPPGIAPAQSERVPRLCRHCAPRWGSLLGAHLRFE